jgi:predicted TIM-barrel fold metal-dependent hydrolase
MICDVQAHYLPKNYSDFMGDRFPSRVGLPVKTGAARFPFSDSEEDIQGRFELMDRAGVEKQILSPNHTPYLPDEAECVKGVKMLNDGYADLAHRYPKRIASYVMLPLPHIDAALREMERGLDQLGCVGVNMHILCLKRSVAETEFEPLYEEMNRRGVVLFVHPTGAGTGSPLINDYGYSGSVGTSIVDAVFVLHMIAKQIPYRYPNIKFIVPHLGGPIPMLLNRLDKQGVQAHPDLPELPSVTAKRFWYDTVCYGSKAAFSCALEAFGADHLVTGSDYPILLDWEDYNSNASRTGSAAKARGSDPPKRGEAGTHGVRTA